MSGSVFFEALRRGWKGMLLWGIGIAVMGAFSILAVPDSKMLQAYADIMKGMPSFLLNMMGSNVDDLQFMASADGYLAISYFGWILLVFATYAVILGLGVTANEEDRGILDVVLSMPLPRWRIIVEKVAAFFVLILAAILISFVALWLSVRITPLFTITPERLFESTINLLPATLVVLVFTALIATIVRRRNTAATIAAAFVGFSYFVDVIGRSAQVTNVFRTLSFYSYFDGVTVVKSGMLWANFLGLLAVAVVMLAGTIYFFNRRDVGV